MKNWDLLFIEDQLTEEEKAVKESVANFVNKEIVGQLQEAHRKEELPKGLIPQFAEMGLFGTSLKGYGCPGLSPTAYGLAMQELEAADSGLRSFCSVQSSLSMYAIYAFGSEEQKKHYLPEMAQGKIIGCFGLTETDAGSNPGGMQTKATKVKGGYELSGSKMWITNGCLSDIAIVWAQLDGNIAGFIVDSKSKGFSTQTMKGKFSLRISVTSELYFDKVFIPEENRLPLAESLKAPLSCLTEARYGIAWGALGAARTCYETALSYSQDRRIFDKAQAGYQLVQSKLVHMVQEITKGQLLAYRLGDLKSEGRLKHYHVSLGKMNNCRVALDIARLARDMLGGNGIIDEYPVIRHMMNLETVNTYEGTEDIHRLILGKQITGLDAIKG